MGKKLPNEVHPYSLGGLYDRLRAVKEVRALFAFTDGDIWRPGIGDPTAMGWVTVAAYFLAAFLCFRRLQEETRRTPGKTLFWGVLALMLLCLGINKQLDLQTWFTLTGKRIAIAQGWYEKRRIVQGIFVLFIGAAGFLGTLVAARLVWRHPELRITLVGFVLLLVFVLARAASFHHMDALINFRLGAVRMNWVLEIGAIAVLALGACKRKSETHESRQSETWVPAR